MTGPLCSTAPLLYAVAEDKLLIHLTPPFARATALSVATLLAAVLFLPLLTWANWNFSPQPRAILDMGLEEAFQLGLNQLPERRGWVSELLAPLFALEHAKLWFVVQSEAPKWFTIWYSLDAALIAVIAARASAIIMAIAQANIRGIDDARLAS